MQARVEAGADVLGWLQGVVMDQRLYVSGIGDLGTNPELVGMNLKASVHFFGGGEEGKIAERNVDISIAERGFVLGMKGGRIGAIYVVKINAAGKTINDLREIFKCRTGESDSSICCVEMPVEVAESIETLDRVEAGFPAESGSFERMLYLSAVIATTVGFGDIVPLTVTARTAVGIEAVLEIILIGLFLNALATKAGGP